MNQSFGRMGRVGSGAIVLGLLMTSVACGESKAPSCGNRVVLEFYEVVGGAECDGCARLTVRSELTKQERVSLAAAPLFEVERCGVAHVYAYDDGVMLVLDSDSASRIGSSEGLSRLEPTSLLLARTAGREEAVSLLRRSDLSRSVPLLDLDTNEEIEGFLTAMDPEPEAFTRHAVAIRDSVPGRKGGGGEPQDEMSPQMLERAERDRPLIEALKRLAREGKTNTREYTEILKELERVE